MRFVLASMGAPSSLPLGLIGEMFRIADLEPSTPNVEAGGVCDISVAARASSAVGRSGKGGCFGMRYKVEGGHIPACIVIAPSASHLDLTYWREGMDVSPSMGDWGAIGDLLIQGKDAFLNKTVAMSQFEPTLMTSVEDVLSFRVCCPSLRSELPTVRALRERGLTVSAMVIQFPPDFASQLLSPVVSETKTLRESANLLAEIAEGLFDCKLGRI